MFLVHRLYKHDQRRSQKCATWQPCHLHISTTKADNATWDFFHLEPRDDVAVDVMLSEKINLVLSNVNIDVKKNYNIVFSDINLDVKMFFETFFEMFLKTLASMSRPFCNINFDIHHT